MYSAKHRVAFSSVSLTLIGWFGSLLLNYGSRSSRSLPAHQRTARWQLIRCIACSWFKGLHEYQLHNCALHWSFSNKLPRDQTACIRFVCRFHDGPALRMFSCPLRPTEMIQHPRAWVAWPGCLGKTWCEGARRNESKMVLRRCHMGCRQVWGSRDCNSESRVSREGCSESWCLQGFGLPEGLHYHWQHHRFPFAACHGAGSGLLDRRFLTCPLFCLQNLTAGDWVSVGIWTALSCKLPICENQSTYFGGLAWKAKPTIRKLLFHWGPTVRWRSDSYSSSFLQARRPGMCVWGRISSWQALASSSFDRSVLAGLRKHVLEAFPGKAGWTLESSTSSWPTLDAGISWSSSRSLWLWVEMSMFIKYEIWDGSSKFNGQAAPIQTTLDPSKQPTRPIQTTITPGLPLQVRIVSHWRWSSES